MNVKKLSVTIPLSCCQLTDAGKGECSHPPVTVPRFKWYRARMRGVWLDFRERLGHWICGDCHYE